VLVFVGASLIQSLLIIQRIAAVSDVRGVVKIRHQGENAFLPLGDRTHVKAGDLMQTGDASQATLNWVDGSRIRVGPKTTMQVLKCQVSKATNAESYLFRLDVGDIWVRVLRSLTEQSKFEIRTPTATAGVRGTVFSVSVAPDGGTSVAVYHGKVSVSADGQEVAVAERQVGAVGANRREEVRSLSPAEQAAWEKNEDVARPALTVAEPAGACLPPGATSVVVSGVAERTAKVTVNGQPVELRLKGQFEATVPVPAGATSLDITVRAEDAKGFDTTVFRRLSR
jgi:hypothetical protein